MTPAPSLNALSTAYNFSSWPSDFTMLEVQLWGYQGCTCQVKGHPPTFERIHATHSHAAAGPLAGQLLNTPPQLPPLHLLQHCYKQVIVLHSHPLFVNSYHSVCLHLLQPPPQPAEPPPPAWSHEHKGLCIAWQACTEVHG